MIAGVFPAGPKLVESVVLRGEFDDTPYDEQRAFPYDKVMELIEAMPTYWDKALYALLAASACRTYEALQVLFNDDVDVEGEVVRLVSPKSMPWHPSYRALVPAQRELLAWKGRTSNLSRIRTCSFEPWQNSPDRVTGAKRTKIWAIAPRFNGQYADFASSSSSETSLRGCYFGVLKQL